ncbi:MAG: Omp28-related outer membrane protein [Bacteroidales bacterium]|nr:Omp28-related outer membrane protein [Bacteroidales bacterium]
MEEYTGWACGNCPDGAARASWLKALRGDNFQVMAIHAGYYAEPGSRGLDLRTDYSDSLLLQAGEYGYPQGTIDRVLFDGKDMMAMGRGDWTKAVKARSVDTATVNLWVGATVDVETRTLTVNVEGYYYRAAELSENRLNVALIQNHINGPQNSAPAGYRHEHVLRDLLTGQWGERLTATTAGSTFARTYTYTIPADYRGVKVDLRNLEIMAFVCEDTKTVLQVTACHPAVLGLDEPAGAALTLNAVENRSVTQVFEADVENTGNDTIRRLGYEAVVNDKSGQYEAEVCIPPYEKRTVNLAVAAYDPLDRNRVEIRLTQVNGQAVKSNAETVEFSGPVDCVAPLSVDLCTDLRPDEVYWYVADAAGNRILEYGPYAGSEAVSVMETLDLEPGLYMLYMADKWWDGWQEKPKGYYKVKDATGLLLGQNYDVQNKGGSMALRVQSSMTAGVEVQALPVEGLCLYPNPAVETTTLGGTAMETGHWVWRLSDMQGRVLLQGNLSVRAGETFSVVLPVAALNEGFYLMTIGNGRKVMSMKFAKN